MPQTWFEREIREQPARLARLIEDGAEAAESAARILADVTRKTAVIVARGSSDNAARYAQYVFGTQNQRLVSLAAPSLLTKYGARLDLSQCVVLAISQSGQSPDLLRFVQEARDQGAPAIVLTNDVHSPLATAANHVVPLHAGQERAVAATKTFTAELVAIAMMSAVWHGNPNLIRELRRLPDWLTSCLEQETACDVAVREFADAAEFVVLGRGYNYATAFELALKLGETCYRLAQPFSYADLLHGPIALLGPRTSVVLIAARGAMLEEARGLLERLLGLGVRVLAVTNDEWVRARANATLTIPDDVPEWLSPVCNVAAGQLWISHLAARLGCDPDAPRGLLKVTRTS